MDYDARLQRFCERIAGQVDLLFFPISADLQYLTGIPRDIPNYGHTMHPGAWLEGLWLSPESRPVLTLPRMTAELGGLSDASDIELVVLGDHDDPAVLMRRLLESVGLPSRPRLALGDLARAETVVALQALLPDAVFSSATELLRPQRMIKSKEEIAIIRRAGQITEAAFSDVLTHLRHGMTELEIVAEVDYQLRRYGAMCASFTTSLYNSGPTHPLIFGKREQTLPRPVNPPTAVLFDFGAVYEGYCYDYGRTAFFGAPNAEMQMVYKLVMAAQAAGVAALHAGTTAAEVDNVARGIITEAGYGGEFRHRLGHSIGLDVHEPPFLTAGDETVLERGMLFTIEPSITQFENFSARVEDVVVVRSGGGEKLTNSYQDLIVVD